MDMKKLSWVVAKVKFKKASISAVLDCIAVWLVGLVGMRLSVVEVGWTGGENFSDVPCQPLGTLGHAESVRMGWEFPQEYWQLQSVHLGANQL